MAVARKKESFNKRPVMRMLALTRNRCVVEVAVKGSKKGMKNMRPNLVLESLKTLCFHSFDKLIICRCWMTSSRMTLLTIDWLSFSIFFRNLLLIIQIKKVRDNLLFLLNPRIPNNRVWNQQQLDPHLSPLQQVIILIRVQRH